MKQTAVKELIDKMKQTDDKVDLFAYSLGLKDGAKWQQEQALEMEKEKMMDAYEEGYKRVAKILEDAAKQNGLTFKSE